MVNRNNKEIINKKRNLTSNIILKIFDLLLIINIIVYKITNKKMTNWHPKKLSHAVETNVSLPKYIEIKIKKLIR